MTPERPAVDASSLPTVTFGPKNATWWGTLGFMAVEGSTLLVAISAYFYLGKNFESWPPAPTPLPDLLVPTINTLLLLAIIVPMRHADTAAKRFDRHGVKVGLTIAWAMTLVAVVLRYWEIDALNTRFDSHAYGSAAWAVLVLHTTLLLVDVLETGLIALLFFVGPLEEKHYADASDAAFYQYFLSLSYVLAYVVVFLSPRWT